ncbi:MAG: hypothetical protein RMK19_05715 [Bacteroidia bacterium]|nr:DUF4384 domain-containing protein [Bacteroidia bacterium]MDW8015490.1 hypothetical protein [Bacteroidia bacterium]
MSAFVGSFLGLLLLLYAQDKVVSGTAEVELLPGWSLERAQRYALQLAISNALSTAFPTQVAQTSNIVIDNRSEGQNAQTRTYFYLIAQHYTSAEWLKTIEEHYTTEARKDGVWVICKVKGKARPRSHPSIPVEIRPLRCRDTAICTTLDFLAGDPFYLYFRAPTAGYLQVFLEDSAFVYRILPYQSQRQSAWNIKPDTAYLFFAPQRRSDAFWIDELILTAERPEVLHRIYVVFSPHPLTSPPTTYDRETGLHQIGINHFHDWLLEERLRSPELVVRLLDISVRQQR